MSETQVSILGGRCVGKSSLLLRHLYGKYVDSYKETVEETHLEWYKINDKRHCLKYIDTAGNIQFPGMQQLYISNSTGFILVYSITDLLSFCEMKELWERIKRTRKNILSIPCVIVGNKQDIENQRQVETFDALEWAHSENLAGCFLEASLKDTNSIRDIFDTLLIQLGNTRATQTGPFRLKSICFNGKDHDSIINNKLRKQKGKFIQKCTTQYEKVKRWDKVYLDSAFDYYKKLTIHRLRVHQVNYSIQDSFLHSFIQVATERLACLNRKSLMKIKAHIPKV